MNESFIHRRYSIVHHNAWCNFEVGKREKGKKRSRGRREVRRVKVHASEGSREGEV